MLGKEDWIGINGLGVCVVGSGSGIEVVNYMAALCIGILIRGKRSLDVL